MFRKVINMSSPFDEIRTDCKKTRMICVAGCESTEMFSNSFRNHNQKAWDSQGCIWQIIPIIFEGELQKKLYLRNVYLEHLGTLRICSPLFQISFTRRSLWWIANQETRDETKVQTKVVFLLSWHEGTKASFKALDETLWSPSNIGQYFVPAEPFLKKNSKRFGRCIRNQRLQ